MGSVAFVAFGALPDEVVQADFILEISVHVHVGEVAVSRVPASLFAAVEEVADLLSSRMLDFPYFWFTVFTTFI